LPTAATAMSNAVRSSAASTFANVSRTGMRAEEAAGGTQSAQHSDTIAAKAD